MSTHTLVPLLGAWRGEGPAFRALADRVRLLAGDGRVASGTRLPAERELALALGVSRTTVSAAYADLRADGHVSSTRGSGSVVHLPAGAPPAPGRASRDGAGIDLTRAVLPCAPQVLDAARVAAGELGEHARPGHDRAYDLVGLPELRAAVAARYTARGLPTRPDEVLVTLGAQHAIGLLVRTLVTPGDRVLVESPCYPHALDAVRAAGGRPVTVPVTAGTAAGPGGWSPEALHEAFARTRPGLAHLVPSFHNPTASTMPAEQRRAVSDLARRFGTRVVVDETTAELAIDGPAPGPFPADAIHVGSASKTLWGGLRIGWIRADARTVRHLAAHRAPWELGTPVLDQLVVARTLPDLDAVLAVRREQLRADRDTWRRTLAAALPDWVFPTVAGGLSAWVHLREPASSALAVLAGRHGVQLTAGPRFGVDGAFERYLRLPFGAPAGTVGRAVELLAGLWPVARGVDAPATFPLHDVV